MTEIIEVVKNYEKLFGIFTDKSQWDGYRRVKWTCDLCGNTVFKNVTEYNYGGYGGVFWHEYPPKLTLTYGVFNKRTIEVCPTHTDTQISKKLEELKD